MERSNRAEEERCQQPDTSAKTRLVQKGQTVPHLTGGLTQGNRDAASKGRYAALPRSAHLAHVHQTYLRVHQTNCCLLPHVFLKPLGRSPIESQDGIVAV